MSKKYLYFFDEGTKAFNGDMTTMKNILGGKGAGLAEMTAAGMPVPQGFTISTEACTQYYADGREINAEITADIFEHVKGLEKITGKKFGDVENPLLVSVRSGARMSMPGMMDTILNLGLNDEEMCIRDRSRTSTSIFLPSASLAFLMSITSPLLSFFFLVSCPAGQEWAKKNFSPKGKS